MAVTSGSARPHMPSDVQPGLGWFDRFADRASRFFSQAWFFAFCVLLVVVWAPSFLMVALLQNSQARSDAAVQDKLNAVAEALAQLMASSTRHSSELDEDISELRKAVGLEDRESSST